MRPLDIIRVRESLTLDDFVVNELLLHLLTTWVKGEVLTVKLEFHVLHGASGAILLHREHDPIAELLGSIGIKGHMILGEDVVLIVHDDCNI